MNLNVNRLNLVYAAADVAAMKANINAVIAKIPANATLTDEARAEGGDIDVGNKIFVEDTLTELNSNGASIMPAWYSISNLSNDLTFFEQSDEIIAACNNLITRLTDAQRIAGREAYVAATKAYELYNSAAEGGVAGAQESYDKLKVRFERQGKKTNPRKEP